ncbi:hypothetical protein GI374_16680 [Paracoccus sp. S-4012]|uniref:DUF6305 family protein n=1 Tax=Paracoccus sp. S-4012 TaxID=2665648 RepID=UPI0012B01198|nr:DUF6305 family protein [Paracoccus sp. S-4012]MRX52015.1 hypothetical protein [Paracoccus sp. S-4012]
MTRYRFLALSQPLLLALGLALPAAAQDALEAPLPVLVASSGQALDAFAVQTLLTRAGVEVQYDPVATAEKLEGIGTLVLAMGASVKGFGAAGITAETELARTQELLDAAEAAGITVIGVHIGGEERRGGLSEQFINLVSSEADALVVWPAGNADGYFDGVAEQRDIPLFTVDQPMQVGTVLTEQVLDQP